jgi:hypothetical protein
VHPARHADATARDRPAAAAQANIVALSFSTPSRRQTGLLQLRLLLALSVGLWVGESASPALPVAGIRLLGSFADAIAAVTQWPARPQG